MTNDHQSASVGQQEEQYDDIAVDAMKYADFMADDWNKLDGTPSKIEQSASVHRATAYLKNDQKTSRDYSSEVKGDAHSHMATAKPIPFSR